MGNDEASARVHTIPSYPTGHEKSRLTTNAARAFLTPWTKTGAWALALVITHKIWLNAE
jgi:hypothetical protein